MMKNKLILVVVFILILFSCTTDDTADIIINDNSITNNIGGGTTNPQTIFLSGTYTENLTLDANSPYKINGSLIMSEGTTLTIPAGMTVQALSSGADVYIAIAKALKLLQTEQPIIQLYLHQMLHLLLLVIGAA